MAQDKFKVTNDSNFTSRRTLNVSSFAGVDYQKAEANVEDSHAVDSLNRIIKDGVNQTRDGWEQIAKVDTKVNGIWSFIAEDGVRHVVCHIGTHLYEAKKLGKNYNFLQASFTLISQYEIENYKSCAFVGANRLYILGGNKYLVLRISGVNYDLIEVEDNEEITYIPTTSIGVTYKDSPAAGAQALDDVNCMTQWRKNKLVSGTWIDDGVSVRSTRFWEWPLDTSIKPKAKTNLNNIEVVVNQLRKVA